MTRLIPTVGQVVTVFRSRLRPDAAAYADHAARMSALARTMPATSSTRSSPPRTGSASRW